MAPRVARMFWMVAIACFGVACTSGMRDDGGDAAPIDGSRVDVRADDEGMESGPDVTPFDAAADSALDASTGDAPTFDGADARADAVSDAPRRDPLAGVGVVETVRSGYMFTEGPHWRLAESALVFSDIPANTIHRLVEPVTFNVLRMPSGNSNGLSSDRTGRLLACEHGNRRVSRTETSGTVSMVADRFGGMRLNSPNDLVVRSDGSIYFTDPPYGIMPAQQELPFNGVFRVAPGGTLSAEWRGATTTRPNGIALAPDERTLFVTDTAGAVVRAYGVATDGSLGPERLFVRTAPNPDGMAVDTDGNLFVTTAMGVQVFAPDARAWGFIRVPMQPANCAFGGPDARTLYITARTTLFRVRMTIAGVVD